MMGGGPTLACTQQKKAAVCTQQLSVVSPFPAAAGWSHGRKSCVTPSHETWRGWMPATGAVGPCVQRASWRKNLLMRAPFLLLLLQQQLLMMVQGHAPPGPPRQRNAPV